MKIKKTTSIPGDFFTFQGALDITRHLWTLTGLLIHSKNVTTSINCTKKKLTKVWGGHGPRGPPGYATAFNMEGVRVSTRTSYLVPVVIY